MHGTSAKAIHAVSFGKTMGKPLRVMGLGPFQITGLDLAENQAVFPNLQSGGRAAGEYHFGKFLQMNIYRTSGWLS
jgi:hypothetical protein